MKASLYHKYRCCISFEGIGGYLAASITEKEGFRMVDIETREFEYQAKRFLEII